MSTRKLSSSAAFSPRDYCIYREVVVERLTQEEVARRYRRSQGRVSQIVAHVRQALEEAEAPEDEARAAARAARRDARECRERREHYLTLAAEGYRQSSEPLVTKRTRRRGTAEEFVEETERPQKRNVQFLKLMVKLNEQIDGSFKSKVQGPKSEVGSRRSEVGGQPANKSIHPTAEYFAIEGLQAGIAAGGSLADVESWNFYNSRSSREPYPS